MKRDTLRSFIRGLVLASLPLSACEGDDAPPDGGQSDASVDAAMEDMREPVDLARDMAAIVDLAGDMAEPVDLARDMAAIVDLAGDMVDMCLALPPVEARIPWGGQADLGFLDCNTECAPARPQGYAGLSTCQVDTTDAGASELVCTFHPCGIGRRPAGLIAPRLESDDTPIAAWLARSAHLEAASVEAFARLADDLSAHGAPARLVDAARRAALDEVRHAEAIGALALAHGASIPAVEIAPARAARPLLEIAIENAVEGCVGETWGAALAEYQSRAAPDPEVRRIMSAIAGDEMAHAELAWALSEWCDARLSNEARTEVRDRRRAAAERLSRERHSPDLAALGLPTESVAAQLFESMRARLWS